MSDFPTVDRVIAELKRLAGGPWNTDREREVGNVMVDARHCLEQLLELASLTPAEHDALKWAEWEGAVRSQAEGADERASAIRGILSRMPVRY